MSLPTVVDEIGGRLVQKIEGLTPKTKAYKWATGPGVGMDEVPAAIVSPPIIERTGIEQAERQLGALDIKLQFEVFFFFDASEVNYTMPQAIEVLAAFTDAIDGDIALGNKAEEAKVIRSEPTNVDSEGGRPLFGYKATVEVLALV